MTGFRFPTLEDAGEYAARELWGVLGSADADVKLIYRGRVYRGDEDGFDSAMADIVIRDPFVAGKQ